MSRTRNHRGYRNKYGTDLWGPGPCSGWGKSADNKRLNRRLERSRANAKLKGDSKHGYSHH